MKTVLQDKFGNGQCIEENKTETDIIAKKACYLNNYLNNTDVSITAQLSTRWKLIMLKIF